VPQVRHTEQLERVVAQAASADGIIVHTLVDTALRQALIRQAAAKQVPEIDLVGRLLSQLVDCLGQQPVEQPGLYRKMREQDFKRIEAIEFAVEHDDGKRVEELHHAEVVLTGVSRVGKTPLSMYLSTMGWKVANVPLVKGINPPQALFEIDQRRVIGLIIEPGQLVAYRRRRGQNLGIAHNSAYSAPTELVEELEFARDVFRRGNFAVVDTTDKPVEESANEILGHLNRRLGLGAHTSP
ncbi:MAG: kinase/pyrophosphorylase, partial [Anaerolineae bacterium]|nr:kinase/pyrophosphorylase [Anaerolineae bacterium]